MYVEVPPTVRIINYFELFLNQLSPLLNLFFIFLLIRYNVMHNNLRVLMSVFCVASMLMALARIPPIFVQLYGYIFSQNLLNYTHYMHDLMLSFFFYVKISFTLERLIATLRAKTYETETRPYFAIASALIMLLIGGLFCTFVTYELSHSSKVGGITVYPDPNFVDFMTKYAFFNFITGLSSFSVLLLVFYYNRKFYTNSNRVHSIGQRYQYSENIRTSGQLLSMCFILFVCNTATSVITILTFGSEGVKPITGALFNFIVAIASTLIPICAIGFHPILRRTTVKYVLKLRPSKYNKRINTHGLVDNIGLKSLITGQQLIVHLDCQRDVYFDFLGQSWT